MMQAGASCDEIASNRAKPVQLRTVYDHLCGCASWDLLQPSELQRLAQEGQVDSEVAQAVCQAVQQIGESGGRRELRQALPRSIKSLQIKVSWMESNFVESLVVLLRLLAK